MPEPIDITGLRFGTWTVLAKAGYFGPHRAWLCRCDCGTEREVVGPNLKSGASRNCGCQRQHVVKHGASRRTGKTRLYRIWKNMRVRCSNPNVPEWENYGGRGITVCEEWQNDFEPFRDWALTHGYADHLTIDRVDNDGNYSAANCRWTTWKVQASNKRHHGRDKLKPEQIPAIRADPRMHHEIAAEYGVSRPAITLIKLRKTWPHIP